MKPGQARIIEASVDFTEEALRTPLIISSGEITKVTLATARVVVECGGGIGAEGLGAIYLSDLWAWPSQSVDHARRDAAMRDLCRRMASELPEMGREPRHPLRHGMEMERAADAWAAQASREFALPERIPRLASLVCLSIFDAAVHDAFGRALGISSYDALLPEFLDGDLSEYFGKIGKGRHLSEFIRREAKTKLDAWIIVGKKDALHAEEADPDAPRDGIPNSVEEWIRARGIFCLKLKLAGKDNAADVERTVAAYRAAREIHDDMRTGAQVRLSIDTNEGNPSPESVVDYLDRLDALDRQAYNALAYIEQPTERDLNAHCFDMRAISSRKPVLVDEGIESLDALYRARELGWTGLALKTCKGHSTALLCVAYAHLHGMPYTLQDLTNPGISALHAAGFASRVETLNGAELNSPQFTPRANESCLPSHRPLFIVESGRHDASSVGGPGLGYGD